MNVIHRENALQLAKQFHLPGFAKDDSNSVVHGKMEGGLNHDVIQLFLLLRNNKQISQWIKFHQICVVEDHTMLVK